MHSGIQYGVEIDLPAATILNIFGLRAQVRFFSLTLQEPLSKAKLLIESVFFICAVLLVAEHWASRHLLWNLHLVNLDTLALLRTGAAIERGYGKQKLFWVKYITRVVQILFSNTPHIFVYYVSYVYVDLSYTTLQKYSIGWQYVETIYLLGRVV